MAKVSVSLNGRAFTIGCEEGQEAYLRELTRYVDSKVTSMSDQVGQIGDLRLLLMASLMVVDELKESERRVEGAGGACRPTAQ
jgi:cell division protein ZapA